MSPPDFPNRDRTVLDPSWPHDSSSTHNHELTPLEVEALKRAVADPCQMGNSELGRTRKESALDVQVGGAHYKKYGDYQPWQVLAKWMTPEELKGAMKKEVITYLAREADKGGREDIEKAMHTLQIYLELSAAHVQQT